MFVISFSQQECKQDDLQNNLQTDHMKGLIFFSILSTIISAKVDIRLFLMKQSK